MTFKKVIQSLKEKKFLITFLMGFSSGVPLLLTLRTLQMWMTESQVDLKTIGFFSLATLPGVWKFVWAPLVDRFYVHKIGRRKTWLYASQICLFSLIFSMGSINPSTETSFLAFLVVLVSFFSATQDIVVDAYRTESLKEEELGIGSTLYVYGYRLAMFLTGAVAIGLAETLPWPTVYHLASTLMIIGLAATYMGDEPAILNTPVTFKETVLDPFIELLKRKGAYLILVFIVLYKVGDNMAGNMVNPFYIQMGFSKLEIASVAKALSLPATLVGSLIGGLWITQLGVYRSLFIFGILQALSTAGFAFLSMLGHNLIGLGTVVWLEDMTAAMGSAAFIAFMGKIANKKFTATQYALLSGLSLVPRTFAAAPTGIMVESLGWANFFFTCTLAAIPGLLMLSVMKKYENSN